MFKKFLKHVLRKRFKKINAIDMTSIAVHLQDKAKVLSCNLLEPVFYQSANLMQTQWMVGSRSCWLDPGKSPPTIFSLASWFWHQP